MEVDDFSLVGLGLGAIAAAYRTVGLIGRPEWTANVKRLRIAGGAGVSSLVGVVVCSGWRNGVRSGKGPEKPDSMTRIG